MKTLVTLGIGLVVGALVATLAFLVLGDEEAHRARTADTTGATTGAAELPSCTRIIPDSVFDALAWQPAPPATEQVGRCEKAGDSGLVTVGDRAVVASAGDRADAAREVYEQMCADLFRSGAPTPEKDGGWLPDGTTACVRMLPTDKDLGSAELLLLTDDEVVQVRVAALEPTRPSDLRAALTQLVEAARTAW